MKVEYGLFPMCVCSERGRTEGCRDEKVSIEKKARRGGIEPEISSVS